jgi:hypothetical protein
MDRQRFNRARVLDDSGEHSARLAAARPQAPKLVD